MKRQTTIALFFLLSSFYCKTLPMQAQKAQPLGTVRAEFDKWADQWESETLKSLLTKQGRNTSLEPIAPVVEFASPIDMTLETPFHVKCSRLIKRCKPWKTCKQACSNWWYLIVSFLSDTCCRENYFDKDA